MNTKRKRVPPNPPSTKPLKQVHFRISAEPGSQVFIAGSFNDWKPEQNPLKEEARQQGIFVTVLSLPVGRHEYKFIINGTWLMDPNGREWAPNNLGTLNNVLVVK